MTNTILSPQGGFPVGDDPGLKVFTQTDKLRPYSRSILKTSGRFRESVRAVLRLGRLRSMKHYTLLVLSHDVWEPLLHFEYIDAQTPSAARGMGMERWPHSWLQWQLEEYEDDDIEPEDLPTIEDCPAFTIYAVLKGHIKEVHCEPI